jgi:hypothetical protein
MPVENGQLDLLIPSSSADEQPVYPYGCEKAKVPGTFDL